MLSIHIVLVLIYSYPENGSLCAWIEALMYYPSMIEFLFIISVNCILLHKIYTSVQRSCFHCHRSKAIEFIWGFRGIQSIGRPLMYATRRLQFELLFPEYIPYMSRIFSQLQASRLDDSEDRNCHHVFCNNGFQYIHLNLRSWIRIWFWKVHAGSSMKSYTV